MNNREPSFVDEEYEELCQQQKQLFALQRKIQRLEAQALQYQIKKEPAIKSHSPSFALKSASLIKTPPNVERSDAKEECDYGLPVMFGVVLFGVALILAYPMTMIAMAIGGAAFITTLSLLAGAFILGAGLVVAGCIINKSSAVPTPAVAKSGNSYDTMLTAMPKVEVKTTKKTTAFECQNKQRWFSLLTTLSLAVPQQAQHFFSTSSNAASASRASSLSGKRP